MMKIRTKLVLTFLAISMFVGGMVIGVYFLSRNVADSFNEINDRSVPRINALQQMKIDSLVIYSRSVELTVEENREEFDEYLEEISHAKEDFALVYNLHSSVPTEDGIESTIENDWNEFVSDSDKLVELVLSGTAEEDEIQEMREELEKTQEKFESNVNMTLDIELARNQALKAYVDNLERSLFIVILGVLTASVTFASGFGLMMSYKISKPLVDLKDSVMKLAKGNYEAEIVKTSDDEIGDLATHFEKMKGELREKDKMQNEFIMVASHELRTPIQPILGAAELALKGTMETQYALKSIQQEAIRLMHLANDILDVTRIESGKMSYNMANINVRELIEEVVQRFRPLIPAGVSIVANISTGNEFVRGDRVRLQQALSNVLNNAIKFTRLGTITVSCAKLKDAHDKLEISISDEGTGIPPEILPRLFTKFVTMDVDGRNKHGTGLGLFISKAIIEDHGGEINVRNDNKGAVFTMILPMPKIEKQQHMESTDYAAGKRQISNT
jgi:signal transduction histidine kinase